MILRAAKNEPAEKLTGLLRTSAYSERISDIAAQMADKVLLGRIHEIEKQALFEGKERFAMFKIDKEFKDRKVQEFGDIRNIWIIAVKRKDRWTYHPSGRMALNKNDTVIG